MKKLVLVSIIYVALVVMSFSCEESEQLINCEKQVDSLQGEIFKLKGKQIDTVLIRDTLYILNWDTLKLTEFDTLFISASPIVKEIVPDTVIVDSIHYDFKINNLTDGLPYVFRDKRGSRWAVSGYPHQAVFKFNEIVKIDSIEINVFGWNEGYTHLFKVFNFSDLLLSSETRSELYSGHKISFVGTQLYLEIYGGNNSWTDIGEVKFYTTNY